MFNLEEFVKKNVINRTQSLFSADLLSYEDELTAKIRGKKVLVIGGAGSIGSSYIKSLLAYSPQSLVVVDTNENALTELTRELRNSKDIILPMDFVTYPMDYSSIPFRNMFISRKGFDIVANFSAHKHVRSEKDVFSIEALLMNNLINARKLLILLSQFPPESFFCVSTDKAANPVNVMGASKRIMEDMIFSYSDVFAVKTARFANVAFSNGSLPDNFLTRLSKKQPLAAPSNIRRYFVSLEESGQICLLASILGNNREIFYPKLKETQMMSFTDIADKLLIQMGYTPYKCSSEEEAVNMAADIKKGKYHNDYYPVYYSETVASGEKHYEEFYTDLEETDEDRYSSLGVIMKKPITDRERLDYLLSKLEDTFMSGRDVQKKEIIDMISAYLPEFAHIETGHSLDEKI